MKKKIAALVCTFALVAAMPVLAWAAGSPSKVTSNTATATQGATLTVTGNTTGNSQIIVEPTDQQASNTQLTETMKIVGTFKVYDEPPDSTSGTYTFTFGNLGEYNGATATVFIEHQNGDANLGCETKTATVSNGTATVATDGLSLVTIAVDTATVTGSTTDASATSPQTDVSFAGVAGATAVCAVAAIGVGAVLRKKATK